ncbi:GntR family transcriptional regulator [Hyphomicrobium sp.]|uniref:FadR/GntR family transcriptional regulator n=1 Tax=Hyphomicrobium sp. TaxID=82 RepID=UPI000F926CAD|nr:GntR family transcriptional regulator [Hyphomicrobium sp.]RUP09919.1 MAG: FadR family transcriptional regulator [Hyphomicrobium sp.]
MKAVKQPDASKPGDPAIGSIRAAATYELVVEQLRKAIFLGRFMPGDKLPPERDLAQQMLVSRTTIREAIRVLEGEGLLVVKRGAAGGLVVLGQNRLKPAEIEVYMETQRGLLDSLFEYRLANECAAASLAAKRREKKHLKLLKKALVEMDTLCASREARAHTANISRFFACDSEFHLAIAQASQNHYLLEAVEKSRAAMFLPVGKVFNRLEDRANDHHQGIYQAIEDQNADLAAQRMKMHIEATRASLYDLMPKAIKAKRP